jgi:hypothetical protein
MKKGFLFISVAFLLTILGCKPFFQLINVSPSPQLKNVTFSETDINPDYHFYYTDTLNDEYLRELRQVYKLDSLTEKKVTEFEKIKAILDWTNKQWTHNGNNTPSKSDPLTILKEAKNGNNFRCVEYGIVSAAALNSINIPSRLLALKTADVEKVKYGAGHVAAETYSKEFKKWIFIDGQFNAIPVLNNIPLNAVEFQKAIKESIDNLIIVNKSGEFSKEEKDKYINWISKYLFYYDISFDNRYIEDKVKINEKYKLMLVPFNAENPSVFQRKNKIDYCLYTNNINDFYQKPN